jgi:hypothetical protein
VANKASAKTSQSNWFAVAKPQALPASTGNTEAGKNFGRVALKKRAAVLPIELPANCAGDGSATFTLSEDIPISWALWAAASQQEPPLLWMFIPKSAPIVIRGKY